MQRTIITLSICLTVLLFANLAAAQKVKVEFDKGVDFSKFKTYTWVKGMPAQNPIINQMIIDAIDQQLAAKGLTKAESGGDLTILFFAALGFDLHVPEVGYSNVSNPQGSSASIGSANDVPQGTLMVDLTDRKTDRRIWRGSARETLSQGRSGDAAKDAQRVQKVVTKAVSKMFDKYPLSK